MPNDGHGNCVPATASHIGFGSFHRVEPATRPAMSAMVPRWHGAAQEISTRQCLGAA